MLLGAGQHLPPTHPFTFDPLPFAFVGFHWILCSEFTPETVFVFFFPVLPVPCPMLPSKAPAHGASSLVYMGEGDSF